MNTTIFRSVGLALLCAAMLAGCGRTGLAEAGAYPPPPPSSTPYVPPYPLPQTPYPLPPPSPTAVPILTTFAPDFAVAVSSHTCFTEEVNFFTHTFTQERGTEPSITVPITFTAKDQRALFQQFQQIDFDSYPATFAIDTTGATGYGYTSGPTGYTFTVRNAGQIKVVRWDDNIVDLPSPAADNLRMLANTIRAMAQRQPSVQNLPPLSFGCA